MKEFLNKTKNFMSKICNFFEKIFAIVSKFFFYVMDHWGFIVYALVILIAAYIARRGAYDIESNDVRAFLRGWYRNFYEDGAIALGYSIGDYTPAYMYILYFISLFKIDPDSVQFIYAIKNVSIFFDYVVAVFLFLIVNKVTKNKVLGVTAGGLFLMAPTIYLNGSFWGQCDSIYVSFLVIAIYLLIIDKQRLAYIFLGVSFAFKLQAIFIVPLFIVLFMRKQLKLRYVVWIPIIYILFAIPSVCYGRPFGEIMKIYFNQTANSYDQLTLNSATFWSLIYHNFVGHDELTQYGIPLAIVMTGIFMYLIYHKKIIMSAKTIVTVALFFSILMPFFMPQMHERYFYLADTICIAYAVLNPKKCYVAILVLFSSMISYMLYLFSISFITNPDTTLRLGAISYIIALIILGRDIFTAPREEQPQLTQTIN